MQIPSTFIEYESQLHWTARVMIRACLLLSLWSLPFPWLHNHEAYAAAENSSAQLPAHLNQFHDGLESPESGWHLHFIYLDREQTEDPLKQNLPPQQNQLILIETTSTSSSGKTGTMSAVEQFLICAAFSTDSCSLWTIPPENGDLQHGPPVSRVCFTGSPRDLTCVSRC